jgi:hypothetical protein
MTTICAERPRTTTTRNKGDIGIASTEAKAILSLSLEFTETWRAQYFLLLDILSLPFKNEGGSHQRRPKPISDSKVELISFWLPLIPPMTRSIFT